MGWKGIREGTVTPWATIPSLEYSQGNAATQSPTLRALTLGQSITVSAFNISRLILIIFLPWDFSIPGRMPILQLLVTIPAVPHKAAVSFTSAPLTALAITSNIWSGCARVVECLTSLWHGMNQSRSSHLLNIYRTVLHICFSFESSSNVSTITEDSLFLVETPEPSFALQIWEMPRTRMI